MGKARDVFLAMLAGLGISVFSHKALSSARLEAILPGEAWIFLLLVPALAAAGIFVARWLSLRVPLILQVAKFGLVGTLGTTIDLAALNFLMDETGIYRGALFPLLKATSFCVALLNGYLWNRNWTFHHHGVVWKQGGVQQFSLFATAAVGGLALNVTVATLVVNWVSLPAGWHPIQLANVGALLALVGTATWDFLCYKFVVFRPARAEGKPTR